VRRGKQSFVHICVTSTTKFSSHLHTCRRDFSALLEKKPPFLVGHQRIGHVHAIPKITKHGQNKISHSRRMHTEINEFLLRNVTDVSSSDFHLSENRGQFRNTYHRQKHAQLVCCPFVAVGSAKNSWCTDGTSHDRFFVSLQNV